MKRNYNYRLIRMNLINTWKYHSKETGFLEWKLNTPQCALEAEKELMNDLKQKGLHL